MTQEQLAERNHLYYKLQYQFMVPQRGLKEDEIYIKFDSSISKWDVMKAIYQMQRVRYVFDFSSLKVTNKRQYTKEEFYSERPTEYFQLELYKPLEIIF